MFGLSIDATLTFGDLIVAVVTAGSVLSAYHAVKNQMVTFLNTQNSHGDRLDRHDERIADAERNIIRIRAWGRRTNDRDVDERVADPDF